MPETKETRVLARVVAARMGLEPWWHHREEVLKVVYRLQGKRAPATECAVCLEGVDLVILAPCGHRCVCGGCAARCGGKCPLCRRKIDAQVAQVFG
jgi:hypothetical protein